MNLQLSEEQQEIDALILWKDMSMLISFVNYSRDIKQISLFPHWGIHRGIIFHIVGYTVEKSSTLWDTPWNYLPHCGIHRGIIFHIVGYTVE